MFTIDLLKGSGVPVKSGPVGLAVAIGSFALPVFIAIALVGSFITNKVKISVAENELRALESKISSREVEQAVRGQQMLRIEKENLQSSLKEVSFAIRTHVQWSPILETIIRNIPETMILKAIEVKEESRKIKRPKEDDPEKTVDVTIPIRTLHLSMAGIVNVNYDNEVRTFRNSLMDDEHLGSRLEDITVAQELDRVNEKDIISYEIYLIFKPVI